MPFSILKNKSLLSIIFALGVSFAANNAHASSDWGCEPKYKVMQTGFSGCSSNVFINPANDTRVNMVLLFELVSKDGTAINSNIKNYASTMDWQEFVDAVTPELIKKDDEAPSSYSTLFVSGEGSRCVSLDNGAADFELAINSNSSVTNEERQTLINARKTLNPNCYEGEEKAVLGGDFSTLKSDAAKQYLTYIKAATDFYNGDFDSAETGFSSLFSTKDKWLKEAASYMVARNSLNRMQLKAFDKWGNLDRKSFDKQAAADAENDLKAYLLTYPNGQYSVSAKGLMRRIYWLAGDNAKLEQAYVAQIRGANDKPSIEDKLVLAQEIDAKLLSEFAATGNEPLLLAVQDLQKMRFDDAQSKAKTITLSEIEGQKKNFEKYPELYDFLIATHNLYIGNNPRKALELIKDHGGNNNLNSLQFSAQIIRGLALSAVNDVNTRGFWLSLIPSANSNLRRGIVELAIAQYDEKSSQIGKIFSQDSLVKSPQLRQKILENTSDRALLRTVSDIGQDGHEKDVSAFMLLYRDLSSADYKAFNADFKLLPQNLAPKPDNWDMLGENVALNIFKWQGKGGEFSCPSLEIISANLAINPKSHKDRLCVGEFVRNNNLDGFRDYLPDEDELGGKEARKNAPNFGRMNIYRAIIAEKGAPTEMHAYALYRAINCFAPSHNNVCGGGEIPISERKKWFNTLKTQHKSSQWAKALRYYW